MIGYVVEIPTTMHTPTGDRQGTSRIYVATVTRAKALVEQLEPGNPGTAYKAMAYDDMPEKARANLLRVARQG